MSVLNQEKTLKNVDLKIPQIGFGTWQMKPGQETYQAVKNALDSGYRFIDTAKAYENEKSVGEAIKDSSVERTNIFLQTKLPAEVKTYTGALQAFDESIKDLNVEYVDSYIIHAPWPWDEMGKNCDQENREVWRAMEEIFKSGRAKSIGVSNFNSHDLNNLLDWSELTVKPAVDQIQYYIGHTQESIVETAEKNGILVQAYSPLATGGLLKNATIAEIASKYNVTVAQIALRFCLQTGVIPLPKARSIEHIKNNAELDFDIAEEDIKNLQAIKDNDSVWHPKGD